MILLPLALALLVLMVDSAIELAFVSSMVGYLHRSGANQYPFEYQGTSALINAKPHILLLNQGHTSNGAAGTALVLISFGGFLTLWYLRQRQRTQSIPRKPSRIFLAYTIFTILSALLTLAALAYTFTLTNRTKGQRIDESIAIAFQGNGYPEDEWTPETWTKALLALPITSDTDAHYLQHWVRIMDGWKWNLIPLFVIGLVVAALSVMTYLQSVRDYRQGKGSMPGDTKANPSASP